MPEGRHRPLRWLATVTLALGLAGLAHVPAEAQNPDDQLGNWLIFNSTIRFSDHWSMFTEGQLRLWEVASNVDETLVRATVHYHFTPDAMVGLGYVRADSWPFEEGGRERVENRLYQQFALQMGWNRTRFEHRYRLEQRWLEREGRTDYSTRARYRLQVTVPLNRRAMEPGAYFLNFYDEIFLNLGETRAFDQNRLYGAGGYQFSDASNLQLGLLWQARSTRDLWRLQVFYTYNFDVR